MNEEISIRVKNAIWGDGYELMIWKKKENKIFLAELKFREYKPADMTAEPTLAFYRIELLKSPNIMQVLMDDLWNCGVRPTEGSGSAGSLKATQNHLEDMRKIVGQTLDKILK